MKKSYTKFFISLTFILSLFFIVSGLYANNINSVNAATSSSVKNTNIEYLSIDKNIVIDENKVCDITETITVNYKQDKINVGLSRNVSKVNKITRLVNGKKYVKRTVNKFKLLSSTMDDEEEFTFIEESGDYFYINTGKNRDYKYGVHTYKFHYLLDMGEDFINKFDDFTFDIMDYGFKSDVGPFTASITLPKQFLGEGENISNVLSFRTNEMAALTFDDLELNFNESTSTITCAYNGFEKFHGLTMQLILPQGYFNTSFTPHALYYILITVIILCVIGIGLLVFFGTYIKTGVVTPEFYPPNGASPLDVAKAYRGYLKGKDFASLIIEWANQGLIKIEIKGRKHLVLTKLKDYKISETKKDDRFPKFKEKEYFKALFSKSDVYDTKKEKHLVNRKLYNAVRNLYEKEPGQTKKRVLTNLAIEVLSVIPLIFYIIWQSVATSYPTMLPMLMVMIFPLIAINVFIFLPMPLWFKILWCSLFGGAPFMAIILTANFAEDIYYLIYIVSIIFVVGCFLIKYTRNFTPLQKEIRGKIIGFKKFLINVELDKLELLVNEDPEYFYNILPYCYIFGITKVMAKKFEALHFEKPYYFGDYNYSSFGHSLNHSMGSIGGGRSSSGGGGGGSGGGGGGSSGGGGGGGGCGGR